MSHTKLCHSYHNVMFYYVMQKGSQNLLNFHELGNKIGAVWACWISQEEKTFISKKQEPLWLQNKYQLIIMKFNQASLRFSFSTVSLRIDL